MYNPGPYLISSIPRYHPNPTYQQHSFAKPSHNPPPNQSENGKKIIQHYSYDLHDQIGKGFSSKVYKGMNEKTSQQVSIKVIEMKLLKTNLHQKLLQSEIECLSSVASSNVLKLHQVYQTQNNTYIITDFCESGDLSKKVGKLTEGVVSSIMSGVINGYKEMKKIGIIHRDLKPANILMNHQVPVIADFGFATTPSSRIGMPNVNVGSPLYMSPEALSSNQYSEKSDIWALGVTVYELLFGKVPWSAYSEKELCANMKNIAVPFPSGVSEECKSFIRGCLEVNCQKRMTVEDMESHSWIKKSWIQEKAKQSAAKAMKTPLLHVNTKSISHWPTRNSPLTNSNNNSYHLAGPFNMFGKENTDKMKELSILDQRKSSQRTQFGRRREMERNNASMQIEASDSPKEAETQSQRYQTTYEADRAFVRRHQHPKRQADSEQHQHLQVPLQADRVVGQGQGRARQPGGQAVPHVPARPQDHHGNANPQGTDSQPS